MVKPDKARQVEQFLLQQHAGKAMADKVPESAVIRLLESLAGQEAKAAPKVRVQRVGVLEEDDDGFDEDDF
jgi:DNA-binding TFAR19-related protein (PDSD5 family)